MKLIVLIYSLISLVDCLKNVTCDNYRICFFYESIVDHCEILIGENCKPPCNITECHIRVENNIFCEQFECFDIPMPKIELIVKTNISSITIIVILVLICLFLIYKLLRVTNIAANIAANISNRTSIIIAASSNIISNAASNIRDTASNIRSNIRNFRPNIAANLNTVCENFGFQQSEPRDPREPEDVEMLDIVQASRRIRSNTYTIEGSVL
jgi:hypothetical protein